ncbi:hypothetical protein [Marinicellulosiphila megalodicopiae]|uniref:hypothetical protein n=1 Tax=Marinicellulosiphila megalodicopiae TaxID=2724896 RepID=UPI003BB1D6B5
MSNHFHLVVFIDQEESKQLTDLEIAHRWHQLYKGTMLTQKFANGENLSKVELDAVTIKINEWRERLLDLGWFVKNINEPLARMANAEDKCTGKFWEGRFKSQALLDEKALLACMAYVDLNPIRAKMAEIPEKSNHTSIKKRAEKAKQSKVPNRLDQQENSLLNFAGKPRENMPKGIPFTLTNYLELVDWTGRQVRKNKRGNIDQALPNILQRLNIEQDQWLYITQNFESSFKGIVGTTMSLVSKMKDFKRTRTLGYSNSLFYFGK